MLLGLDGGLDPNSFTMLSAVLTLVTLSSSMFINFLNLIFFLPVGDDDGPWLPV